MIAVTGGRVSLLGLWFVATALIARSIGPSSFGLYGLCQNAIKIFTGCVGDPLDMAVMRDAPLYLRTDRGRALALIRSAFWLRVLFASIPILFAATMPWAASYLIFQTTDYRLLAILTAVGVLGDFLLRSALGFFQTTETFGRFMAIDVVWQAGRAGAVTALLITGHLTFTTAVVVYVAAPYLAFAVALFLLPGDVIRPAPPNGQHVREILHYGKWISIALAMSAVYERLDLFMLDWFRGTHDVGVYAGALLLASAPDFLNGAIQTVLSPKIAPAYAAGQFLRMQRDYLRVSIPLGAVAAALAVLASGQVIRILLASKYVESIPVFRLLILGTLFELVVTPLPAALVNFVAPRRLTAVTGGGLVLVVSAGLVLIPRYGVLGAAITILSARIVVGIATVLIARRLSRSTRPPLAQS